MARYFRKKWLLAFSLALLFVVAQAGLSAQSYGGGLMYSSYLPLVSLYNTLTSVNTVTSSTTTTSNFQFGKNDIRHYAPGGALTSAFALAGLLTTVDIGIMGGPGPNNIIPNFPIRPFIALNFAYKFTPPGGMLSVYAIAGFYGDLALGRGKNSYDFFHLMAYFRLGSGVSLKLDKLEVFAQVQFGIGLQTEEISLESKKGNAIYEGIFVMVPIALFPEFGVRFWF